MSASSRTPSRSASIRLENRPLSLWAIAGGRNLGSVNGGRYYNLSEPPAQLLTPTPHAEIQVSAVSTAAAGTGAAAALTDNGQPLTRKLGVPRLLPMRFQTNNRNRITYLIVSLVVAVFFNCLFGGIAVALSIRAHNLLARSGGGDAGVSFGDTVGGPQRRRAAVYGKLAAACSALGVLSTMVGLICLFSQPTVAKLARLISSLRLGQVEDQPAGNALRSSLESYSKSH